MTSTQLLEHFDRVSKAPDAVPRLREWILRLTVRGRLVQQDAGDEPASKLLGKRVIRPAPGDESWVLPPGWAWSNLSFIGETIGGGKPSKSVPEYWAGDIPWVSPKDMKADRLTDAQDHISELAVENSTAKLIPPGSLLMVVRGMILAHSFPTALNSVPVTINQDMKAVVPFRPDLAEYLLLVTKGLKPEILRLVLRSTHGTCKLLTESLFSLPLPIPPMSEQRRIAAKVLELMTLCDRLEAAQAERERRRDRLVASSLRRLNQPDIDTTRLRDHARFCLDQITHFLRRPDQLSCFRQALLNLAVRGLIVPQHHSEGSVTEARREKVRERTRVRHTSGPEHPLLRLIESAEDCDPISPPGWRTMRLRDLLREDTQNGYSRKPDEAPTGIPILRISAGTLRRDGLVAEEDYKLISGITPAQREQFGLEPGDLMACRFNGNRSLVVS